MRYFPPLSSISFREKLIAWDQLTEWRERLREQGKRLAVTNGCFDILHLGHLACLEAAKQQGDVLLVGVNGDESARRLKGEGRPLNPEADRAALLAALECVDAVTVFSELDALELLKIVKPDVYVKGGDYTIETINQSERRLVEAQGGKVLVLAGVPGKSTSDLIARLLA